MILYTVNEGRYISFEKSLAEKPNVRHRVYVNITNKCNCACGFCLRATKRFGEDDTLWLKTEPTAAEIMRAFAQYDLTRMEQVVFCGFGEPTMRLDVLLEVAQYLKNRDKTVHIRLNTNGLAELEHGKAIAPLFKGLIDTVSVSLNASTSSRYNEITRNRFGEGAYEAMLQFAVDCRTYVPEVVLTVVDCIGEKEITACQRVCEKVGVSFRVRRFE